MPAASWSRAAADPTLDILDGSRVAQVTVHLGETALQTLHIDGRARPGHGLARALRGGWLVLAIAPVAALFGAPLLTAGLALLGVATGLLGTMRLRGGRPRTRFIVGAGPGADLSSCVPGLQRFPLVTAEPRGPILHFLPEMDGDLVTGCRCRRLAELETRPSPLVPGALCCPIPADARVEVRLGQARVEVVSVAPARRIQPAPGRFRWREPLYQAGSFVVHGALVLAALLVPPADRPRRIERVRRVIRSTATWVPSFRGDPVPFHPSFVRTRDPFVGNTRDPRATPGLYVMRGPVGNRDPHLAYRMYSQAGVGARGLVGRGESVRTVGIGRPGRVRRRLGVVVGVVVGVVEIRGALDRAVIRRVVRRHMGEVRYCHQVWLRANPRLAGRTVVGLVIGADGRVRRAWIDSSTLGDERVASCLVHAVRRWRYPPPRRGSVEVRLPLTFLQRPSRATPPR